VNQVVRPLYALALTFWVGALWTVGGVVAPTLFAALSDRMLAGAIAGRLFSAVAWIGIGSAVYMLLCLFFQHGVSVLKSAVFWLVLTMLLCTLAAQFGIQPLLAQLKNQAFPREVMESVLRQRFSTWHGIASVLYVIQSALGGVLVVLEFGGTRR